jgi:hypothetical protein
MAPMPVPAGRGPAGALSRRRFLAGAAAMAALPVFWRAAGAAPEGAGRALVPREVFFGDPDRAWPRLSPDGAWLAYIAPVGGVRNLWVAPLGDLAAARPLTHVTARPIAGYIQWAFTNRHIVFFEDHDGDEGRTGSAIPIRWRAAPSSPSARRSTASIAPSGRS